MKKKWAVIREMSIITLATIIVGIAVFFFLEPSGVSIGSISSLAMILQHVFPLKLSDLTMILNVVLLIVGFLFIGRGFGFKTVYTSILLPLVIRFFEVILPDYQSLFADSFLDMICYIFLVSIGLAILFNHNASSGGLDIVAKLLNKYLKMDLGVGNAAAGFGVATLSILVNEPKLVVLSFLGTYLNGIVLDHFIFGFELKKRVCILSDQTEQIRLFITREMHSGASIYELQGAYNKETRTEIITIVDKHEYLMLMNYIEKNVPGAFVTVYNVNKIIYKPKPREIRE